MYEVKGITDEVTTCDCCGKKNLKSAVILANEAGEIVYFGSDCAAAALTGRAKNRKDGEMIKGRATAISTYYKLVAAGKTAEQAAKYVGQKGLGTIDVHPKWGVRLCIAVKGYTATYQTL